jgi:hypothetical protein
VKWETVTPLVDDDEQRTYWEPWAPKVGDRVRVTLSGECRQQFRSAQDYIGGPIVVLAPTTPGTHVDEESGKTGKVEFVVGDEYAGRPVPPETSHRYGVRYDTPISGRWRMWGGCYAAIELEPLP